MIRKDRSDVIYKTEKAKFEAVIDDIAERHEAGQPVLVGTASVEKSELLSKMLLQEGIKHEVLNAKNHAREAHIVAEAGRRLRRRRDRDRLCRGLGLRPCCGPASRRSTRVGLPVQDLLDEHADGEEAALTAEVL